MEADFDCDLAYHLSDHAVARFCDIHQSDWTVASGTATDPINRGPPQRGPRLTYAVELVGSANFDVRSMLLNFETSLFIDD